jgi:hypothetical protein
MFAEEILEGFRDRMENIAVFKPLFELEQKRKYDYSSLELGVAVLLLILEKMLKNEECTYRKIALFLQELVAQNYDEELNYDQAEELTHHLVRSCLLNQGRPHQLEYHNYETGEVDEYKFHLVKLKEYEIDDKVVKLELSPAGLELLFKTKEMYNELQVSISQLYLKQQIQKGVFDGALRSVKELKLAVRNEQERLKNLREQIIRDVLQVAREGAYKQELERINDQLEREQDTFQELMELVKETLDKCYENGSYQAEEVNKVMDLKTRLMETTTLHESLLTTKLELENLMNESMENMILNTFSTTLNFKTEVLEAVVNSNSNLNQLKRVIEPLLTSNVNSSFNLNRIFEPQRLYNTPEAGEDELQELNEEQLREQERQEQREKEQKRQQAKEWLLMLLTPLQEQEEIKLSRIIDNLKQRELEKYQSLVDKIDFYPFILNLHQLGVIPLQTEEELGGVVLEDLFWVLTDLVEANPELKEVGSFELVALEEVIKLEAGYVLSDFVIRRAEDGE